MIMDNFRKNILSVLFEISVRFSKTRSWKNAMLKSFLDIVLMTLQFFVQTIDRSNVKRLHLLHAEICSLMFKCFYKSIYSLDCKIKCIYAVDTFLIFSAV